MKRTLAIILATALIVGLCSTASATTFTRNAQCVNQTDLVSSVIGTVKQTNDKRILINYNAQGCSNSYTNYFEAWNDGSPSKKKASKWVTPGGSYYLQNSNAIATDQAYYLKMRGNTRYHDDEGLSSMTLAGYFLDN
jgi:hypothetical protein